MHHNETLHLVLSYVRMIWRYRWAALVTATVICLAGWIAVLALPNQYEASAKIFMDTSSMLRPLLKGLAIDTNMREQTAQMARRTLLTRPNLEAVARESDLHLGTRTPQELESLLRRLRDGIRISGTMRDNIFEIVYQNEDPQKATRVVEALLNLFVEKSLGASRRDTTETRQFLERQIAEYESKLRSAESRLKEFKQKHIGLMPSEGKSYYTRLQSVRDKLADVTLELREAKNRRNALQQQLKGEKPTVTLGPSAAGSPNPLDERIRQLQSQLDSLLLRYTDQHPDVVATRAVLERLKRQRAEQHNTADEGSTAQRAENVAYQELKVELGKADAEVAALEARLAEYRQRQHQLESLVDTLPEIEAELARLNRDYDIHRRNYEELVKRREALELSNEASQTTDEVQFKVVEPPRMPVLPVGPQRSKLNFAVFVLGTGGGVGLAWLLAMLRPIVYTREQLAELTGRPVLGVVTRVWTRRVRLARQAEVASFTVGCLMLLVALALLLALKPGQLDLITDIRTLRELL